MKTMDESTVRLLPVTKMNKWTNIILNNIIQYRVFSINNYNAIGIILELIITGFDMFVTKEWKW